MQEDSMDTNPSIKEADRIALMNMFKAIAAYGRKIRLQRESGLREQEPFPEKEAVEPENHAFDQKEKRNLLKSYGCSKVT